MLEHTAAIVRQSSQLELIQRSTAPGTCGELLQGYLDGQDFLINCPIDLFSTALLYDSKVPGLWVHQAHRYGKVIEAMARVSKDCDLELHHALQIKSEIPRSKGMASSTADLSCALSSLRTMSRLAWSDYDFARHIAAIEPSDGVHLEGISCVNQLTGAVLERWPAPYGLRVIAVDCGGEIETLEFDRERARNIYRSNEAEIRFARSSLGEGLLRNDVVQIANSATISAQLSQHILYKPIFDDLCSLMRDSGALGINCAHSGTVLGVLYPASARIRDHLWRQIEKHFSPTTAIVGDFQVIGGGCYGN